MRKAIGIRFDTDLSKKLSIQAIVEDQSKENLVNRICWDYIKKIEGKSDGERVVISNDGDCELLN